MLFLFDPDMVPGLVGTGGTGDEPLVLSVDRLGVEVVAGWLEGGVELV